MAMMRTEVASFAGALLAARANRIQIPLPEALPADAEDAYRVQDVVLAELGPAAGWKVGAASPSAEPTCAPILAGGVVSAGSEPIRVAPRTGVEVEVAFRIGRAFASASSPPAPAEVAAAIASAHIAVELCATRILDGDKALPFAQLADNQMNLGLALGPAIADWRAIDAERQKARLAVDGRAVVETAGGHAAKNLMRLLVWQVGHCVTRRRGLTAGTVITTGSWTGIHWLTPPARISAAFPGIAEATLDLVAG